jgi:hypothetical protein
LISFVHHCRSIFLFASSRPRPIRAQANRQPQLQSFLAAELNDGFVDFTFTKGNGYAILKWYCRLTSYAREEGLQWRTMSEKVQKESTGKYN